MPCARASRWFQLEADGDGGEDGQGARRGVKKQAPRARRLKYGAGGPGCSDGEDSGESAGAYLVGRAEELADIQARGPVAVVFRLTICLLLFFWLPTCFAEDRSLHAPCRGLAGQAPVRFMVASGATPAFTEGLKPALALALWHATALHPCLAPALSAQAHA